MEKIKCDICIIGAGSGGLSIAAGAVQMGASVVLIEGHKMGGDCLNYGCVPSKALIAAGKAAHAFEAGADLGVAAAAPKVDYAAAKDHVAKAIATIEPHDSQERFEGLGVQVIRDWGRFVSKTEVEAGGKLIKARRFVIATGSSPFVPPIPGLEDVPYFTNETIFELRDQPEHLLVIGGGPIGLEMAQAHRRLGSKVTVIEGLTALHRDDPEAAAFVLENLRAEGIEIAEGAMAQSIRHDGDEVIVHCEDSEEFRGSHILMAVGRKPNLDRLNLEAAGIERTRTGVKVDAGLRSTNRKVFAVGDVAGGLQFTHVAGYHAGIIIKRALFGMPAKAENRHIPWATYTDPELAQIGPTEAQAREMHGDAVEVARFDMAGSDRAIAEGKAKGMIKVMVHKGRPIGATIVGPQAGELISFWALAIANKLKMGQVAMTVLPYPTLSEVNKRAAGAYFSPRLFENPRVKRIVGFVQRWLP